MRTEVREARAWSVYSGAMRKKDRRFKYVILGENKGISVIRMPQIDMADGDFIVLADHDDIDDTGCFI